MKQYFKEITKAKQFIFNSFGFYYNKIKILKVNDKLIIFSVCEIIYIYDKYKNTLLTINAD